MSDSEIAESYENGIFSRAMLVRKEDRPQFARFKRIHYALCTLSWLITIFAVICAPVALQLKASEGLFLFALPGTIIMISSLFLYFRYPQYFTARERPSAEYPSKKIRSIHKCCTNAYASLLCLPGGIVFFLSQLNGKPLFWPLFLAAVAAILIFCGLLSLFRHHSWEYRNFRIGYVSFAFWQVLFCLFVFSILTGLILSL